MYQSPNLKNILMQKNPQLCPPKTTTQNASDESNIALGKQSVVSSSYLQMKQKTTKTTMEVSEQYLMVSY